MRSPLAFPAPAASPTLRLRRSRLRRTLAVAVGAALFAAPAVAIDVFVDPGPIGARLSSVNVGFSNLNGTPANGQMLVVDVLYDDPKSVVTVPAASSTARKSAEIVLRIEPGVMGNMPAPPDADTIATTAFGIPIPAEDASTQVIGHSNPGVDYTVFWERQTIGLVAISGYRFEIQMLDLAGAQVTDAVFRANIAGGEQVVVPEPSFAAQLDFGVWLAAIAARRRVGPLRSALQLRRPLHPARSASSTTSGAFAIQTGDVRSV